MCLSQLENPLVENVSIKNWDRLALDLALFEDVYLKAINVMLK